MTISVKKVLYVFLLLCGTMFWSTASFAEETCEDICLHEELSIPYSECTALIGLFLTNGGYTRTNTGSRTTSPDVDLWWGVTVSTFSGSAHVTELALPNNNLAGDLSSAISGLPYLKQLNLQNNALTSLPESMQQLTNLEQLSLGYNNLIALPAGLFKLPNLLILEAEHNYIASLPVISLSGTSLELVSLHNNRLTTLPSSFSQLTALRQLFLQNNLFVEQPSVLFEMNELLTVHLAGNKLFGDLDAGWDSLDNLIYLNIANNQLTHEQDGNVTIPSTLANWYSRQGFILVGDGQRGDADQRISLVPDQPLPPVVQVTPAPFTIALSEYVRSLLASDQQPILIVGGTDPLCQQLDVVLEITPIDEIQLRVLPQVAGHYAGCTLQMADFDGTLLPPREIPEITVVLQAQLDFCDNPLLTVSQDSCYALLSFYTATNGDNRKNKSGWFVSPQVENRFGLRTQAISGTGFTVTGLYFNHHENSSGTNAMNGQGNGLQGSLPNIFDLLTGLQGVNLGNNTLSGPLPSSFASLTALKEIYLHNNQLNGSLENLIQSGLRIIYLKNNVFSGDVSSLFADLSSLEIIDLSKNAFGGNLPVLSVQAPIRYGNFADNDFSGLLPAVRAQFTKQTHLYLQNNNLEGTIPSAWKNRTGLTNFAIDGNFLDRDIDNAATLSSDLIARWQGILVKSRSNQRDAIAPIISAEGGFTASGESMYLFQISIEENSYAINASAKGMPVFVSGGPGCESLQISDVRVATGTTTLTVTPGSAGIYEGCYLHVLDHGQNFSNGIALPVLGHNLGEQAICFNPSLSITQQECRILRDLYTSTSGTQWTNKNNRWQTTNVNSWFGIDTEMVSGKEYIVSLLFHRNDITAMDVPVDKEAKGNNLRGTLPSSLAGLTKLRYFKVDDNDLGGSLSMINQPLLENVTVSNNNFNGNLPSHRGSGSLLKILDLSHNAFVGSIPFSWKQLKVLESLSVADNQLSGKLDLTAQDWGSLISFSVANNAFTGGLDPDWSAQKRLEKIDFSNNVFAGTIPSSWSALTGLNEVNLSQNKLSGPIPTAFSAWNKITHFFASGNALIGDINDLFPSWNTIQALDVSDNRFTGKLALSRAQITNLQKILLAKNALDRDSNHDAVIPFELTNRWESRSSKSREDQDDRTPTALSSSTTLLSPVAAQVYRRLQRDENSYTVNEAGTGLLVGIDGPGLCSGLLLSQTQIATGGQQTGTVDFLLAPIISGVYSCFVTVRDHGGNISRLPITPFWFKATCGNGLIETVEECDEGRFCADGLSCTDNLSLCPFDCTTTFVDGCNPACEPSTCGDGYVDMIGSDAMSGTQDDEFCDPGKYCADGRDCTRDPSICLTGPAECQPMPTATCSPTCVSLSCGDGYLDASKGEQCDDGNIISSDGCSSNCLPEFCGDGIQDANGPDTIVGNKDDEECDAGINNGLLGGVCTPDCKLPDPSCMICWQYCHEVLESGTGDHAIYLVIDRTGSMNGQNRLENAQDAASTFINLLPGVDRSGSIVEEGSLVGIVTFANGANLEIIHTDNYTGAIDELLGIKASSNADMGAGISLAAQQLATRSETEKWIVLLSDGTPTRPQGKNKAEQSALTAATSAKQAGVKIISIGLQQGTKGKTLLQNISSGTGYYYEDPNNNILTEIYQFIYGKIHCGCTDTQQYCSTCGDKQVLFNEQCDEGSFCDDGTDCSTNSALCPTECKPRTSQTCTDQCQSPHCGDGVLQTGANEQCDDGNLIAGDGCTSLCQNELCGDSIVDINGADQILGNSDDEQCDDGNLISGDGCGSGCKAEICGDGLVGGSEQCDEGRFCDDGTSCKSNPWICPGACKTRFTEGCAADCTWGSCGDLFVDSDGANNLSGDADDEQCDPGKFCPNGIPCSHDESLCPGSCSVTFVPTCTQYCKITYCGDGFVDLDGVDEDINSLYDNELCDDGNNRYGDGCSPLCLLEGQDGLSCGDGTKQVYELCDPTDSNDSGSENCSPECIPRSCGDGIIHGNEECDSGKWCTDGITNCTDNPSICPTGPSECQSKYIAGCTENCVAGCGNGIIDSDGVDDISGNEDDEQCDDSDLSDTDNCTNTCKLPKCGDGIVTHYALVPGTGGGMVPYMETCDDGNTNNGDSCPSTCMGSGNAMAGQCAGGMLQSLFYDNENTTFADISVFCDRGIPDGSPIFDENSNTWKWVCLGILGGDDDICSYDAWACGDGIVDTRTDSVSGITVEEQCDDGNTQSGDGCTASCQFETPLLFPLSGQCSMQSYPAIQPSEYLPVRWAAIPRSIATGTCDSQQTNTLINPQNMLCDFVVTRGNPAGYEQEVGTVTLPCIGMGSGLQLIEDALSDKGENKETILGGGIVSPTKIVQWSTDTDGSIIYGQYRLSLQGIRFHYCAKTRLQSGGLSQKILLEREFTSGNESLCQGQRSLSPSYFMQHTMLFSEQINTGLEAKITNIAGDNVYLADTSYAKLQKSTYGGSIKTYLLDGFINTKVPLATKSFRVDSEQYGSLVFQKIPSSFTFVYSESTPLTLDRQTISYLLSQAGVGLGEQETIPFTIIIPDQRVTTTLVGDMPGKMMVVTNGNLVFAAENCDTNDVVQGIYVANGAVTTTKTVNDRLDVTQRCNGGGLTIQGLILGRDLATTLGGTRRSSIHFWDNNNLLYPSKNNVSHLADSYYNSCVQAPLLFDMLYTKMSTGSVPLFGHPISGCLPGTITGSTESQKTDLIDLLFRKNGYFDRVFHENNTQLSQQFIGLLPSLTTTTVTPLTILSAQYGNKSYVLEIPSWKTQQLINAKKQLPDFFTSSLNLNDPAIVKRVLGLFEGQIGNLHTRFQNIDHPYQKIDGQLSMHTIFTSIRGDQFIQWLQQQTAVEGGSVCNGSFVGTDGTMYDDQGLCQLTYSPLYTWIINAQDAYKTNKQSKESLLLQGAGVQVVPAPTLRQNPPPGATDIFSSLIIVNAN